MTGEQIMARNANDKRKSGGQMVADPSSAEPQPESLDKVRDILFGGQMRAVETRLQGLEERLRREHEALRSDFIRQVGELDARRTSEMKSLASDLKEALRALEKRHVQLEEATSMSDAALRDQLLLQVKAASTEIGKLGERLTAELQRSYEELRSTKTDSAALSGFLSELAARVAGTEQKRGRRG